jgi:uncharacterized membrane protein
MYCSFSCNGGQRRVCHGACTGVCTVAYTNYILYYFIIVLVKTNRIKI